MRRVGRRGENGKGGGHSCGHYRSLAEGGTLPAEATSYWAAGGIPCKARPTAPAQGSWAPPPGGCAAAPQGPTGARVQLPLGLQRGVLGGGAGRKVRGQRGGVSEL